VQGAKWLGKDSCVLTFCGRPSVGGRPGPPWASPLGAPLKPASKSCVRSRRFPDPREMIRRLKSDLDFRVTLWVHPFASPFSASAWTAGADGSSLWLKGFPWPPGWPAFVSWWEGLGAVLDVTSPAAVGWFLGKLKHLRTRYGVDSFKFDAGESSLMPKWRLPSVALDNPNEYTRHFVDIAYRSAPLFCSPLLHGVPFMRRCYNICAKFCTRITLK